jgi:hypothetical protein
VADWATISSLATAGGTLVLAVATFASVRSANQAARTAERALQINLRPLLVPSRLEDPGEKIMWVDGHRTHLRGGRACVEVEDGVVYLAMSLRNVGNGIAVLHGWHPLPRAAFAAPDHADPEGFRRLTRDLYVAASDVGFWQGAVRDPEDEFQVELIEAIKERHPLTVELMYGDHEGGQRMISRFTLTAGEGGEPVWLCSVARHWNLDRPDPR